MTKHEFENVILPFLDYYFDKTNYYSILDNMWSKPIRIGNMILFCSKLYVPDDVIIVDNDDNIIDGYHVCRSNEWNGENIKNKLITLGLWQEDV